MKKHETNKSGLDKVFNFAENKPYLFVISIIAISLLISSAFIFVILKIVKSAWGG